MQSAGGNHNMVYILDNQTGDLYKGKPDNETFILINCGSIKDVPKAGNVKITKLKKD